MAEYFEYTPTEWKAGDTVTSAKLNKLEQGVASRGFLIINGTWDEYDGHDICTLDKTWTEIQASDVSFVIGRAENTLNCWLVVNVFFDELSLSGKYTVRVYDGEIDMDFTCNSADEYPVFGAVMPK